jgi:hypothetical protein
MSGYRDTKKLIEDTLVGRPAGTLILPEGHQNFALSLLDYIRSIELLGSSVLQGIAQQDTVPIQPNNSKVSYVGMVPAGQTYTFTNFYDENGDSISVESESDVVSVCLFIWNCVYWSVQIIPLEVPNAVEIVDNLIDGGRDKALSAEQGKIIGDELFGQSVEGEIVQSDGTTYNRIMIADDKWKTVNDVKCTLIPLQAGLSYTITFGNGIGGYCVVTDSVAVSGENVNYAPGYSGQINTSQGEIVTVVGGEGYYLYVRSDTISGGRVFPSSIKSLQSTPSNVLKRSDLDEELTENSGNPITSGGVFAAVSPIRGVLPVGHSYPPGRQDIPLSDLVFYNRVPGGGKETKRAISNTIPIPVSATAINLKIESGYSAIVYYLRANGTWDSSVVSSGSWSDDIYLAVPDSYNSAGVWLYIRKGDGTVNITTAEAKEAITDLYWDVPDSYYLPVASKEEAQKSISILFIGNSLTQDAVSYLPYVLKNLYPRLNFKFYMWYNGGYTLAQQYNKFQNNQTCEIFSVCENGTSWTNYNNSITMSNILSTYKFDIVSFQEYFNYKSTYTETDLVDFNNCLSYVRSHYAGNFKVATFLHAPLRSSATNVFNLTKSGNELILKKTDAETLIAPGIAVYRALSTDLDSLGDRGHLSPDGTHTQEGLPCLLQTFVVFRWLMRELSIPISVINCSLRITTEIYSGINVPGPNLGSGVIQGTDVQNDLAQDVAVLADKEGRGIEANAYINMY